MTSGLPTRSLENKDLSDPTPPPLPFQNLFLSVFEPRDPFPFLFCLSWFGLRYPLGSPTSQNRVHRSGIRDTVT